MTTPSVNSRRIFTEASLKTDRTIKFTKNEKLIDQKFYNLPYEMKIYTTSNHSTLLGCGLDLDRDLFMPILTAITQLQSNQSDSTVLTKLKGDIQEVLRCLNWNIHLISRVKEALAKGLTEINQKQAGLDTELNSIKAKSTDLTSKQTTITAEIDAIGTKITALEKRIPQINHQLKYSDVKFKGVYLVPLFGQAKLLVDGCCIVGDRIDGIRANYLREKKEAEANLQKLKDEKSNKERCKAALPGELGHTEHEKSQVDTKILTIGEWIREIRMLQLSALKLEACLESTKTATRLTGILIGNVELTADKLIDFYQRFELIETSYMNIAGNPNISSAIYWEENALGTDE